MVPSFDKMMKPILTVLLESRQAVDNDTIDTKVEELLCLPAEVKAIPHGSGNRTEVSYRIAWAKTYLKKYGWIYNPSRGYWKLSEQFDADLESIDEKQITRSVIQQSMKKSEQEDMTNLESNEAFARFVIGGLAEYAQTQGIDFRKGIDNGDWDVVFPNGRGEDRRPLYVVVKHIAGGRADRSYYVQTMEHSLKRLQEEQETAVLLLVFNTYISAQVKKKLTGMYEAKQDISGITVQLWDYDDVTNQLGGLDAHAGYVINPKRMLVEEKLSVQLSDKEQKKRNDRLIGNLKTAYAAENVTVFLGAGVSKDAGVPLWGDLTSKLLLRMISERLKDNDSRKGQLEEIWKLAYQNQEESPLTQMRYIRTAFEDDEYYNLVREVLYENNPNPKSQLLNAIARISAPRRKHVGVRSIVTYNFDDLLEQNLEQGKVDFKIIYREQDMPDEDRLSIYHVHGYLPREWEEDGGERDLNLVFSEEDYHRVYRDAYGWSNLVQLNAFRDTTCLFVGCSLTDPNMRRLLDVAARTEEKARHYAIMKKKSFAYNSDTKLVSRDILEEYQRIDNNIRESYYKSLGINIIWVEDFDEIPEIITGLR